MRGAVMVKVPEVDLTVLSGQGQLSLYQWNMQIARHFFCCNCGVYVFHNKRATPDHMGVNVRCLEDVSLSATPLRATEGQDMTVRAGTDQPHWPGPRAAL